MTNLLMIFFIIAHVESGGNPNAIGKNGEVGIVQISPICVKEVNNHYGTTYKMTDCTNVVISWHIFQKYLNLNCTKEKLHREPTCQDFVRIWNGGPKGYRSPKTLHYWRKFKKQALKHKFVLEGK